MNRRIGESAVRQTFSSRLRGGTLECGGSTPLFVAHNQGLEIKTKVRDREAALANTPAACAPQNT